MLKACLRPLRGRRCRLRLGGALRLLHTSKEKWMKIGPFELQSPKSFTIGDTSFSEASIPIWKRKERMDTLDQFDCPWAQCVLISQQQGQIHDCYNNCFCQKSQLEIERGEEDDASVNCTCRRCVAFRLFCEC